MNTEIRHDEIQELVSRADDPQQPAGVSAAARAVRAWLEGPQQAAPSTVKVRILVAINAAGHYEAIGSTEEHNHPSANAGDLLAEEVRAYGGHREPIEFRTIVADVPLPSPVVIEGKVE